MAVEGLASPVITHRGAWIGMAGSDLDVAQVNSGVEHGRDEGMAEHVGVRPGDPHPAVPARRRVAAWRSIRAPRLLSRMGPWVRVPVDWSMARPTAGGSGIRTTLVPLPQTRGTRCPLAEAAAFAER